MDSDGFCVKDNKTEQILLTSSSSAGLYHIHLTHRITSHLALYGARTNQDDWHARLGHPSHGILRILFQKFHLPNFGSVSFNKIYHTCPIG
jgi:hypothetical protein